MKLKFRTGEGEVVYVGVTDFEGVTEHKDADWRLYDSQTPSREPEDVTGELLAAVDSTDVPSELGYGEDNVLIVRDWRQR